tara:strand:- start:277 stop:501 length:225 start_codon:yes stop_codon:yes gene_type:complete
MRQKINSIVFLILFCLVFSTDAYAYIDPGSGSIILQAIIAAIAGAGTAITIYWKKVKLFFSKIFKKKDNENEKE